MYVHTTTQLSDTEYCHCHAKSLKSHFSHKRYLKSRKSVGKLRNASETYRKAVRLHRKYQKLGPGTSAYSREPQLVCNIPRTSQYAGSIHRVTVCNNRDIQKYFEVGRKLSESIGKQSELIRNCQNRSEQVELIGGYRQLLLTTRYSIRVSIE